MSFQKGPHQDKRWWPMGILILPSLVPQLSWVQIAWAEGTFSEPAPFVAPLRPTAPPQTTVQPSSEDETNALLERKGGSRPPVKGSYEEQEAQIPTLPSAPLILIRNPPKYVPHCERYYVYKGTKLECDSNLGKDGERLREIMQDVPAAIAELNTYQENLSKIRLTAYVTSACVIGFLAGILISHPPVDPATNALRPGAYVMLGSAGIAFNSIIYGLSVQKTNETHLGNAVDLYNAARPDQPIELRFSTKVNF